MTAWLICSLTSAAWASSLSELSQLCLLHLQATHEVQRPVMQHLKRCIAQAVQAP